ncbi:MAG TPA: argininosuccinate synthase [bacterium]|nr:argininosuccinate synthase [bacterium]HOL48978.1 argininosuccinate synthase [bacterium]HPO51344.1 argininosuccinate synthase [bacterium]HXK44336.1 argininosuccinate synthase [bacterium]
MKKIVVAYSGGLDTSVIIKWLQTKYNAEIIAFTADIGQKENPSLLEKKALQTGAKKFYFMDLKDEFLSDYIFPSLKGSALYEGKYPLATALSRPLIAKNMVDVAKKENADAFAHGCTGKGNDQVRFELTFKNLAPEKEIIAPVREWEFKSREEEIEYAKKHNIPVSVTKKKPYSIDWNLWGISIECGILEDPWNQPPEDAYQITQNPEKAPSKPEYIEIEFYKGIPTGINGRHVSGLKLISILNEIGGKHGVGRIDMVENRLVGIKSREIYEAPAAVILHAAHSELEKLILERELLHFKTIVSQKYSELIYYGYWFSDFRICLERFIDETQKYVTGTIRVKLFKGQCTVVGRKSSFSLYEEKLSTYTEKDIFDHRASKGFIDIYGLPLILEGRRNRKKAR